MLRSYTTHLLFLIAVLICSKSDAQTLYRVTHASGNVLYGGTFVGITGIGGPLDPRSNWGCINENGHVIGQPNDAYGQTFTFFKKTDHIRLNIINSDTSELFMFYINGQHYKLHQSNLVNNNITNCTNCSDSVYIINSNGDLFDNGPNNTFGCVDIVIKYPGIDTFTVIHNKKGAGSYIGLTFEEDTSAFIAQPFTDTVLCPGDSFELVYTTNFPFLSGNVFTAQLSNDTGGFSNPVNIGAKTSTTGDTIQCVIPRNIAAGNGYRLRIVSNNKADTSVDNQVDIRIKDALKNFTNTTATPVCTRDTLHLTGSTTTTGAINWAWSGPNSFASSQKDTFIANAQISDSGRYILTATLNSTGCSLSDTVDVEMCPTPDTPTASSNSPVCETFALNLTTSTTTNGVSWSWSGPGSYNSTTQNPTVTSNASSTHAGSYIATATLNGCSSSDTATVVVLPKPAKPTAGATNSPLCQFQDLQLTASNITGASYNWYGPSLFTATTQNPTRYSMTFTDSGYYYVYATVSGCKSDTDSVHIKVNTDPVVNIFPSPGTTICKGEEATFTAVPTNAGTATYGWTVNYITTGTTGTTFKTSTLNNGDVVRCEMISTGTCATAYTDTSNGITMTVNDVKAPSVTISANPNTSLYPNEPVTFTASPTNGGNNPTYQWLRNGSPISGAQSAVWGANANFLSDGDDICVVLFSDHVCPEPDTALSNCIKVDIRLSVATIAGNSNINIYPNPVTNELYIEGIDNGTIIELYDVVGKKIHHATTSNNKYSINMSSYAAGNYVLRITQENGTAQRIKVIKE